MTIPVRPASDRRGPRETLLALTAVYLRHGELDAESRHSVARLAARVTGPATHALDAPVPGGSVPGGSVPGGSVPGGSVPGGTPPVGAPPTATPEWAPLACALAGMLRGEAEHTLRVVGDAVRTEQVPGALRVAMLGLGVRAALAADRPALAARWRAGLRLPVQGGARREEPRKEPLPGHEDRARQGGGPTAPHFGVPTGDVRRPTSEGAENDVEDDPAYRPAQAAADEVVLASLPTDVRELLARTVDAGGWMGGVPVADAPPSAEPGPVAHPEDPTAAAAANGGSSSGDGDVRDAGSDRGGAGEPGADEADADARARTLRGAPTLHVVMDAYHGDVVSMPARLEVLAWRPGEPVDDPGGLPAGPDVAAGEGPGGAWGAEPGWEAEGLPLLTVRVAAAEELPQAPDTEGWHLRFVGRLRALDARTSDGSLLELTWEDGGFVATFHPPDWLEELSDAPPVVATRVTHVVLVPESDVEDPAHGAGPGD